MQRDLGLSLWAALPVLVFLVAGQRDKEGLCEGLGRLIMLFTSGFSAFF